MGPSGRAYRVDLSLLSSRGHLARALGVVCLLAAGYLAIAQISAARLKRANELGLQGHYAAAIAQARKVSGHPAASGAELVQGYAFVALHDNARARDAFASAERDDPNNWAIHENLGVVLARLGDHARADLEYLRALELNPLLASPGGS